MSFDSHDSAKTNKPGKGPTVLVGSSTTTNFGMAFAKYRLKVFCDDILTSRLNINLNKGIGI